MSSAGNWGAAHDNGEEIPEFVRLIVEQLAMLADFANGLMAKGLSR